MALHTVTIPIQKNQAPNDTTDHFTAELNNFLGYDNVQTLIPASATQVVFTQVPVGTARFTLTAFNSSNAPNPVPPSIAVTIADPNINPPGDPTIGVPVIS